MVSLLPLSHLFEQAPVLMYGTMIGAEVMYVRSRNPRVIFETLRELRVNTMIVTPQLMELFWSAIMREVDKQGKRYELRGDVLRVADIGRSSGTLINEGLTRWTLLGDGPVRSGYGIAEYLHQVDLDGRPVVPVE